MSRPTTRTVPRLLSLRVVADMTTVPRSTWYTLVARGEIPVVRVGDRGIRVRESDLLEFIEAHRERSS